MMAEFPAQVNLTVDYKVSIPVLDALTVLLRVASLLSLGAAVPALILLWRAVL